MIKLVFETVYKPGYDPKLKLKTFNEYFSKLPNNTKTFVKVINFAKDVSIQNVTGIDVSTNIADAKNATDENPVQIHIIYSKKETAKPCTCKKFAAMCKACFEAVKDADPDTINVVLKEDDKPKTDRFRFYYDDETNTAILARNVSGAQKIADYIQSNITVFEKAVTTTKNNEVVDAK